MTSLSIIVPTLGRPSLKRTLQSIHAQLGDGDEVIVVADPAGDVTRAHTIFDRFADGFPWRWRYLELSKPGGDMGYSGRNLAMSVAKGDLLCFCDDDDAFAPGALEAFRGASLEVPTLFKMQYYHGGTVLWKTKTVAYGHFGTPCAAIPRIPDKLGTWVGYNGSNNGGDFVFIEDCIKRMGGVEWDDRVVCIIKPA